MAMGEQLEIGPVVNHVQPARWGGRRKGAGRKRVAQRKCVEHRPRVEHKKRHPVHVTLRARAGLPSFRTQRVSEVMRAVLWRQRQRRYANDFQVVEFSIQDNHVHMIVEATNKHDLRSGVSGLVIAFAKRLNAMLGRKGKVWGDRFHDRELETPREVRNVLVYVFRNVVKHGTRVFGNGWADPYSSAWRFFGWTRPVIAFPQLGTWPTAKPRTWLLGTGWHTKHGLLDPLEAAR
jgi:REP element-mobilizing transposase RayT